MAAELIGRCKCPLCGSDKARLTLSSKLLPVLTCNACNMQAFARSDRSDELMRGLLVDGPPPASPATGVAVAKQEPTTEARAAPVPAMRATAAEPLPVATITAELPKKSPFGLFTWGL